MNGETEVGFSLFSFTEAMDAGPIWASGSVAVDTSDTVGTVLDRLEPLAIATFERHYAGILDGSAAAAAQLEADATFSCQRCAADGRIDWTAPARSVHDFIRAQSDPYPGAYGYLDGERVTVWRSRPFGATWHGSPGQIAWRDEGGVYVVCGDSRCVILDEAETRAGRAPAAALIRSTRPRFAAAQVDAGKEAPQ
jgi:methionyl-tRNA formyltransferase